MSSRFSGSLLTAAALCLFSGCSDESPTAVVSDVVTDPYPLAVGNYWEYDIVQSIFVESGSDTVPDWSLSSSGRQLVSVARTEAITGDEAFGVKHHHVMGRLVDPQKADTTVEIHYLAPREDRILLKAKETVSNISGGFIPFGLKGADKRLGTRGKVGGVSRFISLAELGRLLLDPLAGDAGAARRLDALLASDGVINREGVLFYEHDYVFVFNELYKGRNWISEEAGGVGGIETSQKVTNIIPELSGYQGPIAEVEISNTFIEYFTSEQLKIRYYYKTGVGVIQAEIYDPDILIVLDLGDGTLHYLGNGLWSVTKKLTGYMVK